ncbi:MAG: glycosyltransferase family 9 protein [Bacteroidota bacterium]
MKRTIPNKTVVFRLSSIGDIVLASPLLRALRAAAGPKARIDFVVKKEFAELVKFSHHLSVVHEFDDSRGFPALQELKETLRAEHYDLVVDLHNNLRTIYLRNFCDTKELVTVDKRLYERWQLVHFKRNIYGNDLSVADRYIETVRDFGIANDGKGLELFIPDEIQFGISGKMAKLRLNEFEKVIGVCPGAKHYTKRWQKEKFAGVCTRLAKEYRAKVLVFGGEQDKDDCREISSIINHSVSGNASTDFSGEFSLLEVAAAMEFCDVVLTNDTGLMHIACARQRKVVAVFGSTVREFGFAPYGTESIVVENNSLHCRPCSHIGRAECPKGHFKCMTDIGIDEVHHAVRQLIEK